MVDPQSIAQLLENTRRELLDLTLRNTLLNYRLTKARGVLITDAEAQDVYERLVRRGLALTFQSPPKPELPADTPRDGGGLPLPSPQEPEKSDRVLQTPHDPRSLQSRLLATYYAARTHIEERGVNILFVAIGMLHWFEEENSNRELKAPLLLIPVELSRTSAREKFVVKYNEEDVEDNLSIAARLRPILGHDFPVLPDPDDLDVDAYFAKVKRAVSGQPRWSVEPNEIALGFFSFTKFLMYKDLEARNWCTPENPNGNANLAALLRDGFRVESSPVGEDTYLDKQISPSVLKQVTDADSSQSIAMLDVRSGLNLVIQGPPGTGKSQTITNLIADALSRRQRVLFVAEKIAALEVVKRRLDKAGLGAACLELHSHSANKKAVLAELSRTMQLPRARGTSAQWDIHHYKRHRDQLNAYCLALNTAIDDTGWTPFEVIGELVAIERARGQASFPQMLPRLERDKERVSRILGWNRHSLDAKQELVQRLQSHLERMGSPREHIFRGTQLRSLLPSDRAAIANYLKVAIQNLTALEHTVRELSRFMGIEIRIDRADADVLVRAANRALTAPHLRGLELRASDWMDKRDELRSLLECGKKFSEIHERFDELLIPEAWDQNLLEARQILSTTGRKWWRWFSSDYRRTRRSIAGFCRAEYPKDVSAQLELVDKIMEAARLGAVVQQQAALAAKLFGVQWQGLRSDWVVLSRLTDWMIALYRDVGDGRIPEGVIDFLAGDPRLEDLRELVKRLQASVSACDESIPLLLTTLDFSGDRRKELLSSDLTNQIATLHEMESKLESLYDIVTLNNISAFLGKEDLDWVLDDAWNWPDASRLLIHFFRGACLELLLRKAQNEREALRTGDGATLSGARKAFCKADLDSQVATQAELASDHQSRLPRPNGQGQIGVLMREFEKRRKHLPIRKLVEQSGHVIQALKPVLMMSPMSVAAFVPPSSLEFDLVIFDEASQVKPVDAFGAVLRGGQLVVVGDSKQLPPTSFFDSLVGDDEIADDEENTVSEVESVLGLAASRGAPQRMLRWHYRSRHHSLIAVSNQEFYDNRLVVFPNPEPARQGLGLRFHHLTKTIYDRGGSRTNQLEADVVAKAVMVHAKSSPGRTLGVAAFSLQQAEAIRDSLEKLRRSDPSAEAFFAAHPYEPFFIKNLESVQGDERDVIYISVGYGRDKDGHVSMHFGALNAQGGERRLNVLITRARECCEVFSNLTYDDLDLEKTSSRGVASFKEFLKYAQNGSREIERTSDTGDHGVLEKEIAHALSEQGFVIDRRVGHGNFRLDLAVRDPENPSRHILGIECDGPSYSSARCTRDRDRLRQDVLRNLGWSVHRVWTVEWFQRPQQELKNVVEALSQGRLRKPTKPARLPTQPLPASEPVATGTSSPPPPPVREVRATPYRIADLRIQLGGAELHEVPPSRFAEWICKVVDVEGPVHVDEVARRIATSAGVQRVGSRITAAFDAGVLAAQRSHKLRRARSFLWPTDMTTPTVRDRWELDASSRKLDLICPEEISEAIVQVVTSSFGMGEGEIPSAACNLLGFARTSAEMAAVVERQLDKAIESERLRRRNGHVIPPDEDPQSVS